MRPTGARVEHTDWGAKPRRNNSWPLKERACRPPCVAGSSDSLTASACSLLSVFASKFGATGRPRFHLLPLPKPAPAFLVALACWDETSESLRQNAHGKSTSDTVTAVAWFSLAFLQIGRCNRPSTLRLLAMLSLTSLSSLHGFFAWRTGLESGERFSACRYFFFRPLRDPLCGRISRPTQEPVRYTTSHSLSQWGSESGRTMYAAEKSFLSAAPGASFDDSAAPNANNALHRPSRV